MRTKWWVPYAFLALPFLAYSVWVIKPIVETFIISFTNWDGISKTFEFTGWENFKFLFQDHAFHIALLNNVKWLLGFTAVAVPIGLALAMLFNRQGVLANVCKSLIYLPMTLAFVVRAQMWSWILEPRHGVLNTFLSAIGLGALARPWLADPTLVTYALIAVALWGQIAYAMVLFLAGMKHVPLELVEAASVDGATAWQRFWYVILPMLRPAMVIAITISIIDSLRAFDIVYVMTRGGPFGSSNVLANYMYIQAFHNYRMGRGAAIAVIQFVITFSMISFYLRWVMREERGRGS